MKPKVLSTYFVHHCVAGLTMTTLLSTALLGCQTTQESLASTANKIEVQGHRGARSILPENSLPAFEYALNAGVDTLELDMGVTKDNVVVVSHDPWISKSLCVDKNRKPLKDNIPLRKLTYAEVKTYICGVLPHERFPKQGKVAVYKPTLEEVFQLVASSKNPNAQNVHFNIETKIAPSAPELFPSPEDFATSVLSVVRKFNFEDRVILQSFDHRTLKAMKKLEPRIRLAPLFEGGNMDFTLIAKDIGAQFISPEHIWLTKADVERAHKSGLKVIPWTANIEPEWERLISMGVDGIITDDPEALIQYLNKKNIR